MRKPRLAQAARALLVAGLLAVCHGATPPLGQIDKIRCALYEAIDGSTIPGVEQPLLAQVVRLAFHDCVGGCDGWIELTEPDNAGLSTPKATVDALWAAHGQGMTRADFYALAGTLAVFKAARNQCGAEAPQPTMSLWFGRPDAKEDNKAIFPRSHGGLDQVTAYFKTVFGFNDKESVAILGAHTLGRAHRAASGFDGPWTRRSHTLNNEYYTELRNPPWRQQEEIVRGSSKYSWLKIPPRGQPMGNDEQQQIMLNVDMAIDNVLALEDSGEDRACPNDNKGPQGCMRESTTSTYVAQYVEDNQAFINDFAAAFVKMVKVQPAGQNALLESLTWSDSPDESSCQISVQDCRGPPENGAGPMLVGGGAVFRSYETPAPSADQLAVTQGASEEATNGEMQSVTEADATAALAAGGTGMAAAQTVVSFTVRLNLPLAEFTAQKEAAYVKSVATTASVAEADVSIVDKKDVTSRRRALLATAIDLETEVKVQDSTVNSVKNSISEETLMAALKESGLEAASITVPRVIVRTITRISSLSSPSVVPHTGSCWIAAALFTVLVRLRAE